MEKTLDELEDAENMLCRNISTLEGKKVYFRKKYSVNIFFWFLIMVLHLFSSSLWSRAKFWTIIYLRSCLNCASGEGTTSVITRSCHFAIALVIRLLWELMAEAACRFISFFGMVIVQLCFATLSCSPEGSVKEVEELFKLINQSWKPYKPIDLETFSLGASLTKARNVLLSSKLITLSDYLETWLGSFFFFFFPLLSTFLYQMR